MSKEHLDSSLVLDAVRVTEIAAIAASTLVGRWDEKAADQAAVDAMRTALNGLAIDGEIVIVTEGRLDFEALQQRMRDLDRERIARDLHDSVIQQLFATVLDLQSASGRDPAVQDEAINRAVESIDEAMTSLRRTIYDIGHEQRESFEQRLRDVVGSFGAAPFTIDLQTDLGVDLPDDLAEDVSMVVLEALANVARHAHAARCQVRVAIDGRWLLVTVTDDGVGPPAEYSRMSGLMNMTERARLQGGWCWLRPGSKRIGSRLTWSVPLPY
jgi:signal transduction histidine kinase